MIGRRMRGLATLTSGRILRSYHKRGREGGGRGNITQPPLRATTIASAHVIVRKMCYDHVQIHNN
eukprot:scaffold12707_cov67-Skeletonema_dohrnii-CCMP3373.AAC.1